MRNLVQPTERAFAVQRLGVIVAPADGDELECSGAFNPAAARGLDGNLYLFPRQVDKAQRSQVGICRVRFDSEGDPVGVERIGTALRPEAPYEMGLGCEDPRVTFVEPLGRYVMTYTAVGPDLCCPRVALAVSDDLLSWQRIGLAEFAAEHGMNFAGIPNKNAIVFPQLVADPEGRPSIAMLHRPLFPDVGMDLMAALEHSHGAIRRDPIWISFSRIEEFQRGNDPAFTQHYALQLPSFQWNRLRIGGGTPPIRTENGYLVFYHGVSDIKIGLNGSSQRRLMYSAGAFTLDANDVRVVTQHTDAPLLTPTVAEEVEGFVPRVVFPTGADRRTDIGMPNRIDLYYGMADQRIGAARVDIA
jgi:predicted GH43/DUF377 family glycosyl hydrolase